MLHITGKILEFNPINAYTSQVVVRFLFQGAETWVAGEVFGKWDEQAKALNLQKNDIISATLYVSCKKFKNKYFNDLKFREITKLPKVQPQPLQPPPVAAPQPFAVKPTDKEQGTVTIPPKKTKKNNNRQHHPINPQNGEPAPIQAIETSNPHEEYSKPTLFNPSGTGFVDIPNNNIYDDHTGNIVL